MLAALPLLTRIYSPEEFGALAVFVAVLGIFSALSSLRYNVAIPLPRTDGLAANLMALSVFLVTATALLATLMFVGPTERWAAIFGSDISPYLWLIGIGVLIEGLYTTIWYWATRKKAFRQISVTRVEQAVGGVGAQIGLGYLGFGAWGLVIGQVISQGAGFIGLALRSLRGEARSLASIRVSRMRQAALLYSRYPRYSALEALANTAATQIPVIVIVVFTGSAELGLLALAMRIMQAPISLVGTAVSQVFYSQAVEENRTGKLAEFTASILGGLIKIGWGPLLFAAIVAPTLFPAIFGTEWRRAGELLAWVTPWYMLQFITYPISLVLHVTGNLRVSLVLQLFGLAFRISTVLVAGILVSGADVSAWYAVSGAIFYSIYFVVVARVAELEWRQLLAKFVAAVPLTLVWLAAAILALGAESWLARAAGP